MATKKTHTTSGTSKKTPPFDLFEVIDFLPDPTFAIDLDGRVVVWNRAMEEMTDIKAEFMVGRSDNEYSLPFYSHRRPILIDLALLPDPEVEGMYASITRDGDTLYAEAVCLPSRRLLWGKASPIRDEGGTIVGSIETVRDITGRKQAENELRWSEARYRDIFMKASDYLYILDINGAFIETNLATRKSTGYSEAEFQGLTVKDLLPERIRERFDNTLKRVLDRGYDEGLMALVTKTGQELILEFRNSLILDPTGRVTGIRGSARDITERKRTEEALRQSEEKFSKIFHTAPDSIVISRTKDGLLIDVNPGFESVTGYTRDESIGKTATALGLWADPSQRDSMVSDIQSTGEVLHREFTFRRKDSLLRTGLYSARAVNISGESCLVFLMEDITERRLSEKALRQSEGRLSAVIDNAKEIIFIKDRDLNYQLVNNAMCSLFGQAREEILGRRDSDLFDPDVVRNLESIDRRVLAGETVEDDSAKPIQGIMHHFHTVKVPIYDGPGKSIGLCGIARDITERKRAEEALRNSEERFRMMAQASPEIFWLATPDWSRVTYVSPAFDSIMGIPADTLCKNPMDWLNLVHPDDKNYVSSTASTNKEKEVESEFRIIRPDGGMRWIRSRRSPVRDAGGTVISLAGIAEDITQRKQAEEERRSLEEQMIHSQKLEAIGTLAGGIAHDFNNILSAIIGYTELAKDQLPGESPVSASLNEVLRAGDRAKDLVSQILTFSRHTQTEQKHVRVQPILKEALKLLRSSIPSTITITESIDPSVLPVIANPTQVHQVIMNLCTNAYHAMMPEGGELTVRLDGIHLDSHFVLHHPPLGQGPHLKLTVKDTGCGMGEEVMRRIFDPFFTTKEKAKGTGLGLATVHGIITRLGGVIVVNSKLGMGSIFEVYAPIAEGEPDEVHENLDALPQGNGERILLVDDEEAILHITSTMLENLGYRVKAVSSSLQALELFRSAPKAFDLIITDQTMPAMVGANLALEVLTLRPGMPIILMTGHSETITMEQAMTMGIRCYMEKPFTKKVLAQEVHGCIMGVQR